MGARGPYRKRDEVREQILEAAEALLAERMPSEVSVRDVAERAGVQHSVVHRHFETKDRLVAEVVTRTIDRYTEAIREAEGPAEAFGAGLAYMADHRASFAAMTRTLMATDGSGEIDLFPGYEAHLQRLAPGGADAARSGSELATGGAIDPRVLTVALMAFTSGWAFLEDRWLAAGGFTSRDRAAVRDQIATIIEHVIEREAPSS